MTDKKNVSGISDHKKRKGALVTPLNAGLGDTLKFSSWAKERMPEYLWLGLILQYYGRKQGMEKSALILSEISNSGVLLPSPRLSMILNLSNSEQERVYEIMCKHIDKKTLAPLTLLYSSRFYPIFNKYFFISHYPVEERIQIITNAIKLYYSHQSNEATDLRYLSLGLHLSSGQLVVSTDAQMTINALNEYMNTDHEDEKMRAHRAIIRSTEIATAFEEYNVEFSSNFWKEVGMIIDCSPIKIEFPENATNYTDFTTDCRKLLEYVFYSNKEKSLTEDKFDVIIGSVNYALKIFTEINDKALGNSILGRHGTRTIIEIYIMLKYLLKREVENTKIWEEYKLYGVSNYKLVLLKARESNSIIDENPHFALPVIEALVNEIRWEEFVDVDLSYFDKQGIRNKSIDVGEKELYDLLYDYDSNFAHGLWGAIRESSMLHCTNANHQFHTIPDIYANQNLPDVKSDSNKVMMLLLKLFAGIYDIPTWFADKYFDKK